MALMCLVYIGSIFAYEFYTSQSIPKDLKSTMLIVFSIACVILFYTAWWFRTQPAVYEAIVTTKRFIINYPGSEQWSFDIVISDIKHFEHRNTLSHAGNGIGRSGTLLHDGSFHEICMYYGCSINKL